MNDEQATLAKSKPNSTENTYRLRLYIGEILMNHDLICILLYNSFELARERERKSILGRDRIEWGKTQRNMKHYTFHILARKHIVYSLLLLLYSSASLFHFACWCRRHRRRRRFHRRCRRHRVAAAAWLELVTLVWYVIHHSIYISRFLVENTTILYVIVVYIHSLVQPPKWIYRYARATTLCVAVQSVYNVPADTMYTQTHHNSI